MKFSLSKIGLANKIAFIYALLGLFSVFVLNLIWFLPSLNETKKSAAMLQLETAKHGAIEIRSFLSNKKTVLVSLGSFLSISRENQKKIVEEFFKKEPSFFEIALLDRKGKEYLKISRAAVFWQTDLVDQSSQDYFLSAISGAPSVGPAVFAPGSEPYLILAMPIYASEKEISGVLAAKLKFKEISELISLLKISASARIMVVDEKGRLMADSDYLSAPNGIFPDDLGPLQKVVNDKAAMNRFFPSAQYLNQQGQRVLAVGAPIEELRWGVFVEQLESEAYGGLGEKFLVFVIISLFSAAGVIVSARLVAVYLIKPLKRLGGGAKTIGSGDLNFRLDIKSGDEIEELADAFNEMAGQLKSSHDFLERKISLRTRELEVQRDQLDKVAQELIQRDVVLSQTKEKQTKALAEATEAKKKAEQSRLATLNVLEDIDESRRAQEAEKNKVEAVLLSLTDGLIALDNFGKISLINGCAQKLLNINQRDVAAKRLIEAENEALKNIAFFLKENLGRPNHEKFVLEQGGRVIEMTTAQIVGADNEAAGHLIILHDVTREKAIEKMKSEFVSIAAHQLRTPLSAIKWTLRLILDRDLGAISSQQAEILEKGYQSNERMINLVNALLNVARIEEGRFIYKFSEIPFVGLVRETVEGLEPVTKMKNIAIKLELPDGKDIKILGDNEKIKLVLQNLIENSINYSPVGSAVTISLKYDKMKITFVIADHGMGISKDQQSRVFTKFFRGNNAVKTETEGTGLGLFITKNIVESHGGKIWFESEEGQGSTFYFTLPLKEAQK